MKNNKAKIVNAIRSSINASDIPHWAHWLSIDSDRSIYCYSDKPFIIGDSLYLKYCLTARACGQVKYLRDLSSETLKTIDLEEVWRKSVVSVEEVLQNKQCNESGTVEDSDSKKLIKRLRKENRRLKHKLRNYAGIIGRAKEYRDTHCCLNARECKEIHNALARRVNLDDDIYDKLLLCIAHYPLCPPSGVRIYPKSTIQ